MSNKRRVMVSLHHRDTLSLGANREGLGYEAYHWAILITPKKPKGADCTAFDVSDGFNTDPVTHEDTNPNNDWFFRQKTNIDPNKSGRLIGTIMIGKVPNDILDAQIGRVMSTIPVPIKDKTPTQSCVTWILAAIQELQKEGIARKFDVDQFRDRALSQGDLWMKDLKPGNHLEYEV